jgi:hypothetical protein
MSRFIDASQLPASHAQAPADDALWAELYFPRVEDLLRRLTQAEKEERYSSRARLLGSWPITTGFIIGLICIPGCATGAILLMAARDLDLPLQVEEPAFVKADRLAQVETGVRSRDCSVEISPALAFSPEQTYLPGAFALRGTLQSAALTTSLAPQPAQTLPAKPAKRIAAKPISLKPPAERPEPAPKPASLLEKLSGMIMPATQASQQPIQRQT